MVPANTSVGANCSPYLLLQTETTKNMVSHKVLKIFGSKKEGYVEMVTGSKQN
jgi:hypothetical protein